jgi:hypothetical protein
MVACGMACMAWTMTACAAYAVLLWAAVLFVYITAAAVIFAQCGAWLHLGL